MTKLKKKLPCLRRILNKDWETVLNVLTLLFITLAGAYMLITGTELAGDMFNAPGVSDADRLQFLGSMLGAGAGAALAIGGAIFVEFVRRESERRRNTKLLRRALQELESYVDPMSAEIEGDPMEGRDVEETGKEIATLLEDLSDAIVLLDAAVQIAKLTDFAVMRALQDVRRALDTQKSVFERETQIVTRYPNSVAVLRNYYGKIQPAAAGIIGPLRLFPVSTNGTDLRL